jgi:holo-[acyl-carrier protein] synthase
VLIGIDVVERARIERDLRELGPVFTRRVLAPSERTWAFAASDPVWAVSVCVAVKEAVVKAIGGRPARFAWSDAALAAPASLAPEGPQRRLADALIDAKSDDVRRATCQLAPPLARWAAQRGARHPERAAVVCGRIGGHGDAVAVAAIDVDEEVERAL